MAGLTGMAEMRILLTCRMALGIIECQNNASEDVESSHSLMDYLKMRENGGKSSIIEKK